MLGPPAWAFLGAASALMAAPLWRMASLVLCTFGIEQVWPSLHVDDTAGSRSIPKPTFLGRRCPCEISFNPSQGCKSLY